VSAPLDVFQNTPNQSVRLLAMTFGRPLMINTSFTTLVPSMIDDEHLRMDGDGTQPSTNPTVMGLFVYSCGLFEILADILVSFYTPKCSTKFISCGEDLLTQALAFNTRLDRFCNGVPQSLRNVARNNPLTQQGDLFLQQQVLHCRYVSLTGSDAQS
jgi:hypothetical protein